MDDKQIIELYWARDEEAIRITSSKYGRLCAHIANNILRDHEDSAECVNDTYLAVWNAIPTQRPNRLSVFLSRVTRNLALKKYDYLHAAKRDVFLRRYWYFDPIETICQYTGFSQSKVKSMLYETRQKLRKYLESEGIEL